MSSKIVSRVCICYEEILFIFFIFQKIEAIRAMSSDEGVSGSTSFLPLFNFILIFDANVLF